MQSLSRSFNMSILTFSNAIIFGLFSRSCIESNHEMETWFNVGASSSTISCSTHNIQHHYQLYFALPAPIIYASHTKSNCSSRINFAKPSIYTIHFNQDSTEHPVHKFSFFRILCTNFQYVAITHWRELWIHNIFSARVSLRVTMDCGRSTTFNELLNRKQYVSMMTLNIIMWNQILIGGLTHFFVFLKYWWSWIS